LLASLGLCDRYVRNVSEIDVNNKINYSHISPIIEKETSVSKKYLTDAIN